MNAGISEKYRKILDDLNRTQEGPFTAKEAAPAVGLALPKISILLTYFVTKGWLSRVRRGLYITVPLGTVNPQEYKANSWVVAQRVFDPGYIGGWSAAQHWELTEQLFNSVVVFTLRRYRSKNLKIQGVDFVLKFIDKKYFGQTKPVWIDNVKIEISDPIQTVVDILDDPSIGGGIKNGADILKEYFESPHRDDSKMMSYIEARNNRTIYKRLGYLIEACGIDAVVIKEKCQTKISKGFSLLDPKSLAKGFYNSKWNLRLNVVLKNDQTSGN